VAERLPPSVAARYLRQILLAEVGQAGQRRILASVARVAPVEGDALAHSNERHSNDLAHEIASLYALRAGAGLAPGTIAGAGDDLVRDPAARQVLLGARAALAELRAAVFHEGRPVKLIEPR